MNSQDAINKLNKNFYDGLADAFSASREKPWVGWSNLLVVFRELESGFSLADIGCGNGRFLSFLQSSDIPVTYEGFDTSNLLIQKAKQLHITTSFEMFDITTEDLPKNYDVITLFGVLHHIQTDVLLSKVLTNLANHLNSSGMLIFTLWDFDPTKEKTFNSVAKNLGIHLGPNDYILDWGASGVNLRFCHLYTENEQRQITKLLRNNDIKLVDSFTADKANKYFVYKKIN